MSEPVTRGCRAGGARSKGDRTMRHASKRRTNHPASFPDDDARPPARARRRPRRRREASRPRFTDRLRVACVSAGCSSIPSIVLIELIHPGSAAVSALGAIAVAAFGVGTLTGPRR